MITVTFFVIGLLVLLYGIFGYIPKDPFYCNDMFEELHWVTPKQLIFPQDLNLYYLFFLQRNVRIIWKSSWIVSGMSVMILCFYSDSVLILASPTLIPICMGVLVVIIDLLFRVIGFILDELISIVYKLFKCIFYDLISK